MVITGFWNASGCSGPTINLPLRFMQMLNTKYGVTPRIAMNFSMDTSKG